MRTPPDRTRLSTAGMSALLISAPLVRRPLCWFCLLTLPFLGGALPAHAADEPQLPKIAAIVTSYYHNSHADVIVSRLFETDTLDGKGRAPRLKLVSLYTDQIPENDVSRGLAQKYGFPIYDSIAGALTLGTGRLAVDGVLLIAEHGKYPESAKGQILYPKRRFFEETLAVFQSSGRVVPVFIDKHLGASWEETNWIYQRALALKVPLMAGSTLPLTWRRPAGDVPLGTKLTELMALNFGPLETYGYHALEMVQCLAERRGGGSVGVGRVRCLVGDEVRKTAWNPQLLEALLARLHDRPIPPGKKIADLVRQPVLFVVEYRDGLKAFVLTANDAVSEWTAAWRGADGKIDSTLFWTQEERPLYHFAGLVAGIEQFVHTGKPPWPVERTLLVSGMLDALLTSKQTGGQWIETPQLDFEYEVTWTWKEPPPPPPGRPLPGQ